MKLTARARYALRLMVELTRLNIEVEEAEVAQGAKR